MKVHMQDYVENRDGGLYIAGTRIALDGIIHAFRNGAAPESILRSFPLVGSLERVYGAITFYLANQSAVDQYLDDQEKLWREIERQQSPLSPNLAEKLHLSKQNLLRT